MLFRSIYQISYGLAQYAIRQQKPDPNIAIEWFDDEICGAIARYALMLMVGSYQTQTHAFKPYVRKPIDEALLAVGVYAFTLKQESELTKMQPVTFKSTICPYADFTIYQPCGPLSWKQFHPMSMAHIGEYTQFIKDDGLSIDFKRWAGKYRKHADITELIEFLSEIEPADYNRVKATNGYYVDRNGNKWDTNMFAKNVAEKHSASMGNCKNCKNCTDCHDCESCDDCHNCSGCRCCTGCTDCNLCKDCKNCLDCHNCKDCDSCHSCDDGIACHNCNGCVGCHGCNDCSGRISKT